MITASSLRDRVKRPLAYTPRGPPTNYAGIGFSKTTSTGRMAALDAPHGEDALQPSPIDRSYRHVSQFRKERWHSCLLHGQSTVGVGHRSAYAMTRKAGPDSFADGLHAVKKRSANGFRGPASTPLLRGLIPRCLAHASSGLWIGSLWVLSSDRPRARHNLRIIATDFPQ